MVPVVLRMKSSKLSSVMLIVGEMMNPFHAGKVANLLEAKNASRMAVKSNLEPSRLELMRGGTSGSEEFNVMLPTT